MTAFALLLIQCLFIAFYSRDLAGRIIVGGVVGLFFAHPLREHRNVHPPHTDHWNSTSARQLLWNLCRDLYVSLGLGPERLGTSGEIH